ncbi:MAG TPA: heat-inducible transcriptional repressor HrcA [Bacteroidota bacterium]|nr:heat-inducible transcriptional repressor HrcA [Bacteroidota bacterium]
MAENLNEREESVLRHVVHNYISTAIPVGSRYISKHYESHLSSATIRNVMSDLEESGYLSHPHTSAGRIPTDLGYRYYVDFLMELERISEQEKEIIREHLDKVFDADELLRDTSKLLSKISNQLSIVTSPHLSSGVFRKLELVQVSSSKLMVLISVQSGIIRTIILEVGIELKRDSLDQISALMNERLHGLTLKEIKETFVDRLSDYKNEHSGLVRLFIDSVDQLFNDTTEREKVHIAGTGNLIDHPEFGDPKNFRSIIEMVENEDIIVHLLEKHENANKDFVITIGTENQDSKAQDYSLVSATYDVNGVFGRVGILGPTRMNYSKLVPLVEHVAKTIARLLVG